jgi:hypothetical protein
MGTCALFVVEPLLCMFCALQLFEPGKWAAGLEGGVQNLAHGPP